MNRPILIRFFCSKDNVIEIQNTKYFVYSNFHVYLTEDKTEGSDVIVVTVATEVTHGLLRFERSARIHGLHVEILGKGTEWRGGDMRRPGGGHKVNLLRDWVEQVYGTLDSDTLVMFTDR